MYSNCIKKFERLRTMVCSGAAQKDGHRSMKINKPLILRDISSENHESFFNRVNLAHFLRVELDHFSYCIRVR